MGNYTRYINCTFVDGDDGLVAVGQYGHIISKDVLEHAIKNAASYSESDYWSLVDEEISKSYPADTDCVLDSNPLTARRKVFSRKRNYYYLELIKLGTKELCAYCQNKDRPEIDHIIPISAGGSDELTNLQILCRSCNAKKGARV